MVRRARANNPRSFALPLTAGETESPGIFAMIGRLNLSQWLVLIYPLFLFIIHRRRDEGDVAVVDTSATIQIALTAVCGLWALNRAMGALKIFEKIVISGPLRWLMAYGILAVLSCSWSDMPTLTLFRGGQLVVYLLLVVDAVTSLRDTQEMLQFQLLYAAMAVIFWQLPLLQNGISIGSLHSSDVPGTIIAAVFMGFMVRGKQWRMLHLALLGALMAATSTGALFACVGGVIVILLMMRGRASGFGVILLCASLLALLAKPELVTSVFFFGKQTGQILSGTGRIPIWQWIIEERVSQRPILGFGFGQGEVQARLYNIGGFRMMHMHNAFMSALVNLGVFGVVLWAMLWGALTRTAWNIKDHKSRLMLVGAATAVFLNTISMESVTAPLSMPWIAHAIFFTLLIAGDWTSRSGKGDVALYFDLGNKELRPLYRRVGEGAGR
jgi:hypothetical protein